MRRLTYLFMSLAALVASCARPGTDSGTGYLTVQVRSDAAAEVVVKSGGEAVPVFSLTVTSQETGAVTTVADCRTLAEEPLELTAGRYTLRAASGPAPTAAWNAPTYAGSADILVKPDQVNTAEITCTLSSVMVTVDFEDRTDDLFTDYQVTVENGLGDALVFSKSQGTLADTAYFAPTGQLIWELYMVNTDGRIYQAGPETLSGVKARQHYHFQFNIQEGTTSVGAAWLRLGIDDTLVEKEYPLTLDFTDDGLPSTTASFDMTNEILVSKGSTAAKVVTFHAPKGLKSVRLSHASADLLALGLPQVTELVEASDGTVAALAACGVTVSSIVYGSLTASIDLTALLSGLDLGTYPLATVITDTRNRVDNAAFPFHVVSPVDAEAVSATPWARFAILKGLWYTAERPSGLKFQYRKASDADWIDVTGAVTYDDAAASFSSELYGLDALTAYVFRAVCDHDPQTREISFTTGPAETVPNLDFDAWYQDGKVWYPNVSGTRVWDSANPGTGSMALTGYLNPTTPETSDVAVAGSGKKAARLESSYALIKFAAGNIYLGKFGGVAGTGAYLDWGYRFSSRPVALHGYYKYAPKAIDYAESPYTGLKDQMDHSSIKVYLTDWTSMFRINTSTQTFLSDDDPSIIAIGDFTSDVTDPSYVEFTLPLQYRDLDRTPTYIVIVAAASRLGDYFTGAKGSVLLVDEFSLVYDAGELTESERETVGYRK